MSVRSKSPSKIALQFVILIAVISLFADFTYEGARSINGQFLATLGASSVVVGFVVGLGELLGYGLRYIFGLLVDRSGHYWPATIIGYAINLMAVPALALAGSWPIAVLLILAERIGRSVRKPPVDAMLSYAGSQTGQGWAFGLHEALDQTGATLGPLVLSLALLMRGSYRYGYSLLLVSAGLAIVTVLIARIKFPEPQRFDVSKSLQAQKLKPAYWWYMLAAGCVGAGFADFALVGFHFEKSGVVHQALIPVLYALAMSIGAAGSLLLGRFFDRKPMRTVIVSFMLASAYAPLVFLGSATLAVIGMLLWGLGMAAIDSLLKSLAATAISGPNRASAFGLFDTGFGVFWFAGSWFMGYLYSRSLVELVVFSVAIQLVALPIFWYGHRQAIGS